MGLRRQQKELDAIRLTAAFHTSRDGRREALAPKVPAGGRRGLRGDPCKDSLVDRGTGRLRNAQLHIGRLFDQKDLAAVLLVVEPPPPLPSSPVRRLP